MQFFHDKITKLSAGWNDRPLTEADFYKLCRKLKITVEEYPLTTEGFYYRVMGSDYIVLDSRLTGVKRLLVMFHELGHFLFHAPDHGVTANFHGVGKKNRKETEADVFALCALIPGRWIKTRTPEEIAGDEGIPLEMIRQRLAIYERHKM